MIGINSLVRWDAQNINYAIAASYALPIIAELQAGNNRHDLGLALDVWMRVIAVTSGGAADHYGVQLGDVVLAVDDTVVNTSAEMCRILRSRADGDILNLTIARPNTDETFKVAVPLGGGEDESFIVLVTLQMVGEEDHAALEQIMGTFRVVGSLP